jgi:uncharacterized protein (TIGR03083 family)
MLGPAPATGRFGLAERDPAELGREVLAAWDAFLDVAGSADLSRPSRLPGWSGRDTCVHLGSWDDSRVLDAVLESARTGELDDAGDPDEGNARLLAAHRDASDAEVLDALERARARIARFFAEEAEPAGRLLSRSTVGPLPVLSLVHAGTYELAVHALDLAPCGAPPPAAHLLDRGLAALLDVTGALSARAGVDIALTGTAPTGGWRFTSGPDGWTTERVPAGPFEGVGVRGSAVDLLDASAGRTGLPHLLLARRLHVQQLPQWMRLAPLLDDVPGLPGGAALKAGVGGLSSVVGGVGKVLGRFRR